jgi:hypothetical protein
LGEGVGSRRDDASPAPVGQVRVITNDNPITLAEELGPDSELAVWIALCFGLRYEELFGLTIGSVESHMHRAKVDIFQTIEPSRYNQNLWMHHLTGGATYLPL